MGNIKDAMTERIKTEFMKTANELRQANYRREKPAPFTVLVEKVDDLQIFWVYAPDGERVPYVLDTAIFQSARNAASLEFTAYINIYGYPTVAGQTIAACAGYGIEMPNGHFFLVNSFSLVVNPDEEPIARIKVPCVVEFSN